MKTVVFTQTGKIELPDKDWFVAEGSYAICIHDDGESEPKVVGRFPIDKVYGIVSMED